MNGRLAALENDCITRDRALNIASTHSARQVFVTCEPFENIKHALQNKIHPSGEHYNINEIII